MNSVNRTVVVGVDASTESNEALEWARSVAGPDDKIIVIHAWEMPLVTGYDVAIPVDPTEIEEYATKGLGELIGRTGDSRLSPVVHQGHAGRAIVSEAENADLIVVGHSGDSRVSMMLGSTANYVLHHTDKPVVVVRGDHTPTPCRIIVGVDDHDLDSDHENESVRALKWAYRLPGVEHIRVAHAWFLPALAIGYFPTGVNDMEAMDQGALDVVSRVMDQAGPPPDGVVVVPESVRGTAGFALIEASRESDLVVVGSRGRGGFSGLLLGSTSAEVAAHSHAPVAVVR